MHCPITVTKASPRAVPIRAATDQKLCATPLAAICTVPKRAVILLSATFVSWNSPFSIPFGTAIPRIRFTMLPSQWKIFFHLRRTRTQSERVSALCLLHFRVSCFSFWKQSTRMTTAENVLAINDG